MRRCLALIPLSACQLVFSLDQETPDAPLDAPTKPNVVFVTSIPFAADIGLAGADQACRDRAKSAGLDGDFVAWLSDSTTSAFDRLVGSRGWVRTDGVPVADSLDELLGRGPRVPIAVTENSESLALLTPARVRTGTTLAGPTTSNCSDWSTTNTMAFGLSGEFVSGGNEFTESIEANCSESQRLLCFERGKQVEVPSTAPAHPIVFVTSTSWQPDRQFADADELCSAEASAPLPGKSFKAVITDEGSLEGRFPDQTSTVFARPDGVVVGTVLAPGASLATFINVTATGAVNLTDRAWTGANRGLTSAEQACGNWSNMGATGVVGAPHSSVAAAFDREVVSCATPHPIYCAEVPPN